MIDLKLKFRFKKNEINLGYLNWKCLHPYFKTKLMSMFWSIYLSLGSLWKTHFREDTSGRQKFWEKKQTKLGKTFIRTKTITYFQTNWDNNCLLSTKRTIIEKNHINTKYTPTQCNNFFITAHIISFSLQNISKDKKRNNVEVRFLTMWNYDFTFSLKL